MPSGKVPTHSGVTSRPVLPKHAQAECVAHDPAPCDSARHCRRPGTRPPAGSRPCSDTASGPPTGRWATTPTRPLSGRTRTPRRAADIVIAEIGAWSNPLSPDGVRPRRRARALQAGGSSSPTASARAAASTSPARAADTWDAPPSREPQPRHVRGDRRHGAGDRRRGRATADVLLARADAVEPPDSPNSLPWSCSGAIDRRQFAVHLDPVNLINSPAKFYRQRRGSCASASPSWARTSGVATPRTSRSPAS